MADNTTLNTASGGDVIASDDIGGVKYQRAKLSLGADGSAVDAVAGAGAVGTGVQRVTLASDDPAVVALQTIDNLVLLEDAAHGSGDPGVQALAVRNDSDASLVGTTGDYSPLQVDANGYLKVNIKAGAGSGGTSSTDDAAFTVASGSGTPAMGYYNSTPDAVDSGDVGVLKMTSFRELQVVASDGSGNPITPQTHDAAVGTALSLVGGRASNSIKGITQVANGDAVYASMDLNGVIVTRNATTLEEIITTTQTNTDGSEDAITAFAAGGAGIHNYITSITVSNSSASTFGTVDIVDGTGGTVIWTIPAPGSSGATLNFDPPLKQPTANTGLFFDPSAAISTITISLNGFQAQG